MSLEKAVSGQANLPGISYRPFRSVRAGVASVPCSTGEMTAFGDSERDLQSAFPPGNQMA